MKRHFGLVALLLLAAANALAQGPAMGVPTHGTVARSGFDTVNMANLNAVFSIPIVSVPARGMTASFAITHNTSLWGISYGAYWTAAQDFGWILTPAGARIMYAADFVTCESSQETTVRYSNFQFVEADGSVRSFTGFDVYDDATACGYTPIDTLEIEATDGSGYMLFVDMNGDIRVSSVASPKFVHKVG